MIVKMLSYDDYKHEFKRYSRENQFSEDALKEIYSSANEDKIKLLDVIEICSYYSEITPEEFEEYYSNDINVRKLLNGKYLVRH